MEKKDTFMIRPGEADIHSQILSFPVSVKRFETLKYLSVSASVEKCFNERLPFTAYVRTVIDL